MHHQTDGALSTVHGVVNGALEMPPLHLAFAVPLTDDLRAAVIASAISSVSFALGQLPSPWPVYVAWAAGARLHGGADAASTAETAPPRRPRPRPCMSVRRALATYAQHARLQAAVTSACADPAWEVTEALLLLGASPHTPRYVLHLAFGASSPPPPWAPREDYSGSSCASGAGPAPLLTAAQVAAVGRRTAAALMLTEAAATLPPTRLRVFLRVMARRTRGAAELVVEPLPAGFSAARLALRSPAGARGRRYTAVQMLVRQQHSEGSEEGSGNGLGVNGDWCVFSESVQGSPTV